MVILSHPEQIINHFGTEISDYFWYCRFDKMVINHWLKTKHILQVLHPFALHLSRMLKS